MVIHNERPLEIAVLPDGRVRIGETVLTENDSEKFIVQTLDNARGRFVLVPVTAEAGSVSISETDPIAQLIQRFIEGDPHGRRVEEARLRDYGYAVWALLGDLLYPGRTRELVAQEYAVPIEAVDAVWNYYLRNRAALDRRLAENRAA